MEYSLQSFKKKLVSRQPNIGKFILELLNSRLFSHMNRLNGAVLIWFS
jgi:hypothetical protein